MSRRARLAPLLLFAAGSARVAGATTDPAALLAATDLFAAAPDELRLELSVAAEGAGRATPLEVFRAGHERVLIRFLGSAERGKFVLREGGETWFLAPGARAPVRMGSAFRLQGGAAIDELLGLELARDYRIESYEEVRGVGTFDLAARAPRAPYPKVRWAVDVERRLPLRAELRSAAGRALRIVELRAWLDPKKLVPREVAITDLVRRGPKLVATFEEVEAVPLDPRLFSPTDGAARAALPASRAGDG
jgi:hypothetical protein